MKEMGYLHQHGWPMVMVAHWHGLEHGEDSGYQVHERLVPRLLASGTAQPMNMTHLSEWVAADASRVTDA